MTQYIARRILIMFPVALLVTVFLFVLIRQTPGDPVLVRLGEEATPENRAALRAELGLDQPVYVQYGKGLTRIVRGDLGRSIRNDQPVSEAIVERLPATLELGLAAFLYSVALAIPLGALAALYRRGPVGAAASAFTFAGVSMPGFFLGLLLILVFSLTLGWLPPGGYVAFIEDPLGNLKRLILPAITLGTFSAAINMRLVRSSLLDAIVQDYIRTARAKGLSERMVFFRHALRNALIPVVTIVGIQVAALWEGAVVTETIFAWPGVGRLVINSIGGRDYAVVQAVVLIAAFSYMISSLLVDIAYAYLDPRISYGNRRG
ncbi:MAG: ABC transporter permease [Dehalococcoidia bacterium]